MTPKLSAFVTRLGHYIVHSPPIEWLDNFQYFEGDLDLIFQWGVECYFPKNMTKNARSPVTYMLGGDNCWLLNDIDSSINEKINLREECGVSDEGKELNSLKNIRWNNQTSISNMTDEIWNRGCRIDELNEKKRSIW